MPSRDFGVYVHIPFCQHQCAYCTFYTLPNPSDAGPQRRLMRALAEEWRLRVVPRLEREDRLRTLYLGGGTPSDSPAEALVELLGTLASSPTGTLAELDELTVECNPESASETLLDALRAQDVDRISLGVQALDDEDLRRLDRRATAEINRAALRRVAERFDSWNADLIVGAPGSTQERLQRALEELADVGAPHLSFYCLEMPPERARRLGDAQDESSDAHKADLYAFASAWVTSRDYEHYEISNAARPGRRARHNEAYWDGRDYVGLGPGAHSFEHGARRANRADLAGYTAALEAGRDAPHARETLTPAMRRQEALLLGLRRRAGVDERATGLDAHSELLERLRTAGLAQREAGRLRLTPQGWLVCDSIVLQLVTALEGEPPRVDKLPAPSLHSV